MIRVQLSGIIPDNGKKYATEAGLLNRKHYKSYNPTLV
jgi:hypothetical protein